MAELFELSVPASGPTGGAVSDLGTRGNRDRSRASSGSRRSSGPASVYEPNATGISPIILNASFAPHTPNNPPAPRPNVVEEDELYRPTRHSLRRIDINQTVSKVLGIQAAHVSLFRPLTFGVAHVVAIGVLLGLASRPGSAHSIPGEVKGSSTTTGRNQWEACRWPLAAWDIVWAVKAAIWMGMAVWNYRYVIKPQALRNTLWKKRDKFMEFALVLELCDLLWFIVANVLLYGSRRACHIPSPYIWWLTFELVCWGYLVALELFVEALVRGVQFICHTHYQHYALARNESRNSALEAHPQYSDSGTSPMPRELVDRIPLAVYIPAILQDETNSPTRSKPAAAGTKPNPIHPPKLDTRKPTRVKLLLFPRKKTEDDPEAMWQKTEYPFVRLESNQAVCAVCKVDFEPPRRVGDVEGGAEAEALRLLACGHVFHIECLDPWLVGVSARCPTCQRRVKLDDLLPVKKSPGWLGVNLDIRTWFGFRPCMRS
ncbi:hypothetical protein FRC09_015596 [Ceratobasidium sp. 395]|nr:hypothetical protein FRC09_015596 [Ceratobasidium sp. 395]